jgi:intergrase/recombinase
MMRSSEIIGQNNNLSIKQTEVKNQVIYWKTVGVRIRSQDLPILNQRLRLYGFETLGQLVSDFLTTKFPPITEDRQIQAMDSNTQSNGLKTLVNSGSFEPTFYKNVNLDDMLKYLLTIRKLDNKHVKDIVSYFRRFRDLFFGPQPEEILKFNPPKRGWIIQAMRHFGNYYYYKTNNPECKELVEKIINRYGLNIGLDMHQRIYIVDDNFVSNKVKHLLAIQGDIGQTVKVGLFTGLREDEIIYIHNKEICSNLGGCSCNKLHLVTKPNGLTVVVVNWFRGHKKCYFTILPTVMWEQFRNIPSFNHTDIDIAHKLTKKNANLMFVELRKLHYNIMRRSMDMNEADILAGRAKSVSAKHYAIYELDKLTEAYAQAWEKFGVNIAGNTGGSAEVNKNT